jgi:hypothetical protein
MTAEAPYQVTAVVDLASDYSVEHFRYAIGICRGIIAKLIAEHNRSDQQRARYRILRYVDLQLARGVRWAEDEADLMASVMRSLIELKFWAKFVSESEAKATQFLNEANIDTKELYERLEKLTPSDSLPMSQLPSVKGKRVSVQPSGDQEQLTWKVCSKLIHPTSWGINHFEETVQNADTRQFLAIQVLLYGWGIVNIFHDIVWEA